MVVGKEFFTTKNIRKRKEVTVESKPFKLKKTCKGKKGFFWKEPFTSLIKVQGIIL
jgi:hypothetical protein